MNKGMVILEQTDKRKETGKNILIFREKLGIPRFA